MFSVPWAAEVYLPVGHQRQKESSSYGLYQHKEGGSGRDSASRGYRQRGCRLQQFCWHRVGACGQDLAARGCRHRGLQVPLKVTPSNDVKCQFSNRINPLKTPSLPTSKFSSPSACTFIWSVLPEAIGSEVFSHTTSVPEPPTSASDSCPLTHCQLCY